MLVIQVSDCFIRQSSNLNLPAHFTAAFMSKLKNRSKRKRNVVGAYKILYAFTFNTPVTNMSSTSFDSHYRANQDASLNDGYGTQVSHRRLLEAYLKELYDIFTGVYMSQLKNCTTKERNI